MSIEVVYDRLARQSDVKRVELTSDGQHVKATIENVLPDGEIYGRICYYNSAGTKVNNPEEE